MYLLAFRGVCVRLEIGEINDLLIILLVKARKCCCCMLCCVLLCRFSCRGDSQSVRAAVYRVCNIRKE
jgi:hypothetical protein